MQGKLEIIHGVWHIEAIRDQLSVPLCKKHDDYIKGLSKEYVEQYVKDKLFDFELINEFSNPEEYKDSSWGEGEVQAVLVSTNRSETWEQIFMKYNDLTDGDFIDTLNTSYHPPKTKMPF
jgi:hypothetical protein